MIKKIYFYSLLLICFLSKANSLDSLKLPQLSDTTLIKSDTVLLVDSTPTKIIINQQDNNSKIYNPPRDKRRLLYNTGMYFGTAIISFAILWVTPESFSNWDKEEIKTRGFFTKWKDNITQIPHWDHDDFVLNYITHPYSGGVYYMSARGSGFKPLESFLYSAFMSTVFWEYGVEAFAERPSLQDLIITPAMGAAVGEGFFNAKRSIIQQNKRLLGSRFLGGSILFLIDPFNQILDWMGYKTKDKNQVQAFYMPIDYNLKSSKTTWGISARFRF